MKVLFLDFDGVLNHHAHFVLVPSDRTAADAEHDDQSFDKACVARLNTIVERTGCYVVISSTWRLLNSMGKISRILRRHGFVHERRIVGKTPALGQKRGYEIQAWLDEHPDVESFAILDDNSDMAHLKNCLVQTSFDDGLQDKHVESVVRLLGDRS